jgi:hypothetical protein
VRKITMARKAQEKPMFIPYHKPKKVKLSVEISNTLLDDLKLYNEFLNENGHESKLDDVVETVLETIRKDKIFANWTAKQNSVEPVQKKKSNEKIIGAQTEAQA